MRAMVGVLVIIAIVVIGIIGYAVAGLAWSAARVAAADRTLNSVVSHQNNLNSTFKDINGEFSGLSAGSSYNPQQARSVADRFVANAGKAGIAINQDDAALASASASLHDQSWLTAFNRGSLDRESARIAHARRALSDARTVMADYVLDGRFLQAFLDATNDLDAIATQTASSDLSGAATTLSGMKLHVDKALQLSSAPGLPTDLKALVNDFEALVADFEKLVAGYQTGDDAGVNAAAAAIQSDADKISGYNFERISTDIDAFYKPMIDDFNSQMAAATA